MIDFLHAFAVGISFSVGIATGALLMRIATKEGRNEMTDDWREHRKVVEERLGASARAHTEMAVALQAMALEKVTNKEG